MVDWPAICRKYGWNPKALCGPVIMATNSDKAEEYCVSGHSKGCQAHKAPMVNGKPFRLADHRDELLREKLTVAHPQLAEERGKKPPGTPKKVGSMTVYPARHFA